MARHATALEDRLDVAPVFDGDNSEAPLMSRETQASFVFHVPFLFRFIAILCREQWRRIDQIPHLVIRPRSSGGTKIGGLLTVRVAATTVVTHFARTKLVPCLCRVQHHATLVEGLESERRVRRNFRQKARVGISVRVLWL